MQNIHQKLIVYRIEMVSRFLQVYLRVFVVYVGELRNWFNRSGSR